MPSNNCFHKQVVGSAMMVAILVPVVRLIGSFFKDDRLWGINHAGYIDGLWFLYPVLILGVCLVYIRKEALENILNDGPGLSNSLLHKYLIPLILLIAVPVGGFYLLSVKEYFLGDGYYMIASMADPDIGFKARGYGEMLLHRLYMEMFYGINDYYAFLSYRHLSGLAGIVYVISLLHYGRKIAASVFSYYAFVALSLTMAATILFYGYIENYSLLTTALFLFFISGAAAIKNRKWSYVPLLSFAAAVFLHFMAVVYLPAFVLYIIAFVGRGKTVDIIGHNVGKITTILLAAVIVFYAGIKLMAPLFWRLAFLSPLGDRFTIDGYTLLSGNHIVDYFNLLVFLIPVTLVVWGLRRSKYTQSTSSAENATLRTEAFITIGAVMGLAAAFIIEPKLGMARDWDMMSVLFIGGGFAGVYIWVTRFRQIKYFRSATLMLFIMSLSVFVPWLALHNTPSALYDYSISMMELDSKHSRADFFRMVAYNEGNKHPVEAARLRMYCRDNYPEMWLNREGMELLASGDLGEAEDRLHRALEHNPAFFSIYFHKALVHLQKGEVDSVIVYLDIADALNPGNTFIHAFLGLAYYHEGHEDLARESWLKSIEHDARDPIPFLNLGYTYLQNDMPDSARNYLSQYPGVLNIYPVYFQLGTSHLMLNDSLTVFDAFRTSLSPEEDSTLEYKMAEVIADLRNIHWNSNQEKGPMLFGP